jgi:MFS family permease
MLQAGVLAAGVLVAGVLVAGVTARVPAPRLHKPPSGPEMRPWRFVVAFGAVSMLLDFVYEGARSITGPLLASLGASALAVGLITGVGEAAAFVLRLASGPLADRTRRFWSWTIAGYALTAVTVPVLGLAGALWAAAALVIAERVGKAVRSPAKDTLLSHATAVTGRGRGFAVHEAMDQLGALIGPLTVAAMLAATGDDYAPSLAVLAVPGIAALTVLAWLRARVPDPSAYERTTADQPGPATGPGEAHRPQDETTSPAGPAPAGPTPAVPSQAGPRRPETADPASDPSSSRTRTLPRQYWVYACFTAATLIGFSTFGVLSYHLVERRLVPAAAVPVVYAAAMGVDALAALATGWAYDRVGARALATLPVLSAGVPLLAFTDSLVPAVIGVLLWGAALGVQESTLRATVADLIPPFRRATAYGIFAAIMGTATLAGGALAGALYTWSVHALIIATLAVQAAALLLLAATRPTRPPLPSRGRPS